MTREEALSIIENENLICYSWFGKEMRKHWYFVQDITVIDRIGKRWVTYIIGERDSIIANTQLYFDSEEEALDDFIRRLKLTKREIDCGLEERRKKELARETEGETQDHD